MTDTTPLVEIDDKYDSLDSIGKLLKAQRESRGQTRSDLSSITKITVDQITALEEGRLLNMPSVYTRGFMRAICEELGLDTPTIMSHYRKLLPNEDPIHPGPLTAKYGESELLTEERGSYLWPVLLSVLGLIILVTILWLFIPTFRSFFADLTQNQSRPQSGQSNQVAGQENALSNANPSLETTHSSSSFTPDLVVTQAKPDSFSGPLTLTAVKTTWAQVVVDNKPMEHLLFEAGQTHVFTGQKSIAVAAGDGHALKVEWNGKDAGFLGPEGPVEVYWPLSPPQGG
ncbi:MAG: DUF4115 domain-containing protein [Deltaproteobacteria bacterium]|nr:DUF4115 domain-containing protein [Deltaproteobacteria bacterium]